MHTLLKQEKSIAANADEIWLNRHFLHWWLLPSHHVHASWLPSLVPDALTPLPATNSAIHGALHQHWSSQLLARQNVDAVQLNAVTHHRSLPLCLAPQALFDTWLLHAGMLISSPQLVRCIDRASRVCVQQALGEQTLAWVIQTVPQLRAGLPALAQLQWHEMDLAESMRWLGAQLLWAALANAPSALHERMLWQLPLHWQSLEKPTAHWPSAADALGICLELMNTLDSAWLSSLPKTH